MSEHITLSTSASEIHSDSASTEETPAPDSAEIDNETQPLYPSVQHVMDSLQRIIDENAQVIDVQHTTSGEPILAPEIIETWGKEVGFGGGKRDTYHNADTYVYIKHCNLVPKEEDVDETIATARHLTSLGAIHPESQWGVFKTDRDGYQLFVVSPKLEAWSLEEKLSGTYENRPIQPTSDRSHLMDWYKRIDPNFIPGQPIPEDSLLYHLNWHEASHNDNWGWDQTGTLFPIDVEVLRPASDEQLYKDREPWKLHDYAYAD